MLILANFAMQSCANTKFGKLRGCARNTANRSGVFSSVPPPQVVWKSGRVEGDAEIWLETTLEVSPNEVWLSFWGRFNRATHHMSCRPSSAVAGNTAPMSGTESPPSIQNRSPQVALASQRYLDGSIQVSNKTGAILRHHWCLL